MATRGRLELEGVSIAYDGRVVTRDISLYADPGELGGLIGPNGSGKSSLIRAISRVIPTAGGRILLGGRQVGQFSRQELSRLVAVVPQNPHLPETFTALEIVLMGRNPHLGLRRYEGREDYARCRWAMEATHCWHLARRFMGEVSGSPGGPGTHCLRAVAFHPLAVGGQRAPAGQRGVVAAQDVKGQWPAKDRKAG